MHYVSFEVYTREGMALREEAHLASEAEVRVFKSICNNNGWRFINTRGPIEPLSAEAAARYAVDSFEQSGLTVITKTEAGR